MGLRKREAGINTNQLPRTSFSTLEDYLPCWMADPQTAALTATCNSKHRKRGEHNDFARYNPKSFWAENKVMAAMISKGKITRCCHRLRGKTLFRAVNNKRLLGLYILTFFFCTFSSKYTNCLYWYSRESTQHFTFFSHIKESKILCTAEDKWSLVICFSLC